MRQLVVCGILAGLAACGPKSYSVPPPASGTSPLPEIQESVVRTTFSADLALLRDQLRGALPSPLSRGTAKQRVPIMIPVTRYVKKIFDVPRQAVRRVLKKVPTTVKVAGCLFNPLACVTTVLVDKWVDEVFTVIDHVERDVAETVNEFSPLDVVIHHEVLPVDARVAANGSSLTVTVVADIAIKIEADATIATVGVVQCGHGEPKARVEFSVSGSAAISPDAKVTFNRSGWDIKWVKPCNLTALNVSAETLLDLPVIKGLVEKTVDRMLDKQDLSYSFAKQLNDLWQQLSEPRALADSLWLGITPERAEVANVRGIDNTLAVDVGLGFQARVVYGERPAAPTAKFSQLSAIAAPAGFQIHVLGSVTFAEAEKVLTARLKGKQRIEGHDIEIRSARLYGTGNGGVVVGVTVCRPFKATLYLIGKPRFDTGSNELTVQDLDYSLETRSLLLRIADYLLHTPAKDRVAKAAHFNIGPKRREALDKLHHLAFDAGPVGVTIDTTVLEVDKLVVGDDAIHVVTTAAGKLEAAAH